MRKYEIDMQAFLCQANWGHQDFGVVAKYFSSAKWYIYENMLKEEIKK